MDIWACCTVNCSPQRESIPSRPKLICDILNPTTAATPRRLLPRRATCWKRRARSVMQASSTSRATKSSRLLWQEVCAGRGEGRCRGRDGWRSDGRWEGGREGVGRAFLRFPYMGSMISLLRVRDDVEGGGYEQHNTAAADSWRGHAVHRCLCSASPPRCQDIEPHGCTIRHRSSSPSFLSHPLCFPTVLISSPLLRP